ncbi:substrate-binding domain-containing protein, partial [Kitasatospora sp. NPDC051914]|uniref:substrate-binding domain-containing protein n=1 Tax=Kitasatospora sp. NPDC051914 TaxID=3154945 RepID=UPI0034276FA9
QAGAARPPTGIQRRSLLLGMVTQLWPARSTGGLDAVFGYNDEYAALLSAALTDCGVAVPDRVAVVGADDLLLARVVRPRLTSVRYHLPGVELLADAVDGLIENGTATPLPRIGFDAVPRQSS